MIWLSLIIAGCVVCFFTMVFLIRKAYQENTDSLDGFDACCQNWKVILPLIIGMNFSSLLHYPGGLNGWLSIAVLIIFLAAFLVMVYSYRKMVKANETQLS